MNCKNCQISLKDTDNFCSSCGAKIIRNRLTVKNLFTHFTETFFNYDNKVLNTFITLFTKPDLVIASYINGIRVKYVNVISYFAISLTVFGIQLFIMNLFYKDAFNLHSFNENMSGTMDSPENFLEMQSQIQTTISNYQSLLYIVTVPITAFVTWLVFYITSERTYNYTEHIVINLYYSAQVIIITALSTILLMIFGVNFYVISFFVSILSFIYLAYIFKKLYNLKIGETILKTLLFTIIFALTLLFITVIIILILVILIKVFGLDLGLKS